MCAMKVISREGGRWCTGGVAGLDVSAITKMVSGHVALGYAVFKGDKWRPFNVSVPQPVT